MTNGVGHEAGETARGVVSALSGQPVMIFLLVFILAFLGIFAWVGKNQLAHYDKIYDSLLENQSKMLAICNPTGSKP